MGVQTSPVKDRPPHFDSLGNGGVGPREDHIRHFLGDLRTARHGDANIGLLEGWSVIDAIPAHCHELASTLENLDDLDLVRRRGAGENPTPRHTVDVASGHLLDATSNHLIQLAPRDHFAERRRLRQHPDILRDGQGSTGAVTSDHHGGDPGFTEDLHSVSDFRTSRVRERDQTGEHQLFLDRVGGDLSIHFPISKRKDPIALGFEALDCLVDVHPMDRVHRNLVAVDHDERAQVNQTIGCTLGEGHEPITRTVNHRHHLSAAREEQLHDSVLARVRGDLEPGKGREFRQRTLGRIPQVVAQVRDLEKALVIGMAVTVEAVYTQRTLAVQPDVRGGHPAFRHCTSLVGTDDGDRTQPLGCPKLPDDRLVGNHLVDSECESDRNDRTQGLRDEGDGEGNRIDQRVKDILSMQDIDTHHCEADDEGTPHEELTQLVQLSLKWGLPLLGPLELLPDGTQLRILTGRRHHEGEATGFNVASGVDHICPITEWGIQRDHAGLLRLGDGFPREQRLVDLGVLRTQHKPIRRSLIALLEEDDVTRYEFGGEDLLQLPIPVDPGIGLLKFLQFGEGLAGLAIGVIGHQGHEHHDAEDQRSRLQFGGLVVEQPNPSGQQRCPNEGERQLVGEGRQQGLPPGLRFLLGEAVGAVL